MECEDRRIKRAVTEIKRDLTKRHTLRSAAAITGLKRGYFSKLFLRTMGEPFSEWNARLRVEAAKAQLRILDLQIHAIAVSVGYSDDTTFTRVFRRLEGLSPRRFRALSAVSASARRKTPISGRKTPKPEPQTPSPTAP